MIKTIADLRKALEGYADDIPVEIYDGTDKAQKCYWADVVQCDDMDCPNEGCTEDTPCQGPTFVISSD